MAQHLQKVQGQPNLFLNLDSGIFWLRVMIDGRDKFRSTRVTTLKAAISASRTMLGKLEEGRGSKDIKVPTLKEWWITYQEATKKAPTTEARDESTMRLHILPHFGDYLLTEITQSDIKRYLNWRKRKAAEGTVDLERAHFHKLFEAYIDDDHGVLLKNPCRKIERADVPPKQRVVTLEEQAKLEADMQPEVKRYFLFMLGTGIRVSEGQTLKERDINWEAGEFSVIGRGNKQRWVPLLPESRDGLTRLLREQLDSMGRLWPQDRDTQRMRFHRACKKVGVAPFGPHTLRHTFATRYLQGGGDIYILSKILGHASVEVTQKVYAHLKTRDLAARSVGVELGVSYGS